MNRIWLSHWELRCRLLLFLWLPFFTKSQGGINPHRQLLWPLSVLRDRFWTFGLSSDFLSAPPRSSAGLCGAGAEAPCPRSLWQAAARRDSAEPGRRDVIGLRKSRAGHLAQGHLLCVAQHHPRACLDRRGEACYSAVAILPCSWRSLRSLPQAALLLSPINMMPPVRPRFTGGDASQDLLCAPIVMTIWFVSLECRQS